MTPRQALVDLAKRHQNGVWRFLRLIGCDAALADDLTQEVFLYVYRHPMTHVLDEGAYLRTAARHIFLNVKRDGRKLVPIAEIEQAEALWRRLTPRDDSDERLELLAECLKDLPERARRAVDLAYREGKTSTQVGDALGASEDGAKALLKRARHELRDCIERKQAKRTP